LATKEKKKKHVIKTKVKPTGMKKERPIENHEATSYPFILQINMKILLSGSYIL